MNTNDLTVSADFLNLLEVICWLLCSASVDALMSAMSEINVNPADVGETSAGLN